MTTHFVLPGSVDEVPSGGNVYDRRLCERMDVREVAVHGEWPRPRDTTPLDQALHAVPDGDVVLLDGLVACGVPEVVVPHAKRLRLAVLVHLPLADETGLTPEAAADLNAREREVLHAAHAVVATSPTAAEQLTRRHGLDHVHVVTPGVDPAPLAEGTDGRSHLLCVASITPRKGHDRLLEALRTVDGPFSCELVGPFGAPEHVARVEALSEGMDVTLTGPLTGKPLADAYARADLFVLASRAETYGMVITEALARGIPVLATAVVPDALGDGGLAVEPDRLADTLRRWFTDAALRDELRHNARARRARLSTWDESTRDMERVLASLRA